MQPKVLGALQHWYLYLWTHFISAQSIDKICILLVMLLYYPGWLQVPILVTPLHSHYCMVVLMFKYSTCFVSVVMLRGVSLSCATSLSSRQAMWLPGRW